MRGYSLLEMLVVIGLLALSYQLFMSPSISLVKRTESYQLQTRIEQVFMRAQEESYLRHRSIGVCFADDTEHCVSEWMGYVMIFADTQKNGDVVFQDQKIEFIDFSSFKGELKWRAYPRYRHYILFSDDTMLENDNGTFWFCAKGTRDPLFAFVLNKSAQSTVIKPGKNGRVMDSAGFPLVC